jgi:hypothetical protein
VRRIDYDTEQYQDYARGRALTEQQSRAWISAFAAVLPERRPPVPAVTCSNGCACAPFRSSLSSVPTRWKPEHRRTCAGAPRAAAHARSRGEAAVLAGRHARLGPQPRADFIGFGGTENGYKARASSQ